MLRPFGISVCSPKLLLSTKHKGETPNIHKNNNKGNNGQNNPDERISIKNEEKTQHRELVV